MRGSPRSSTSSESLPAVESSSAGRLTYSKPIVERLFDWIDRQLERALRVIPMGRRNWLFCWSELGAKDVGIVQSLIVTCRLHDIDPYTYLVDVLQRVGEHPASQVAELTPRLWKQHFASNPLRSDIEEFPN
jgi:hypothetical protein